MFEMSVKQNKVYIATVGSSKEPILRGLLYSTPDIAYLLYSLNPKYKNDPELVAKTDLDLVEKEGHWITFPEVFEYLQKDKQWLIENGSN